MRGRRARPRETRRSCVGCRRRASPGELLRLAVDGDRIVVSRTASGRGAWLCPDRSCLERARRSRAIERALRRPGERGALDLGALEVVLGAGNGTT